MKKGIVLLTVIAILIIIIILSWVSVCIMTQQSKLAEHKIKRAGAMNAAQAGVIHVFERLRREGTGNAVINDINNDKLTVEGIDVSFKVIPKGNAGCPNTSPSDFCVQATAVY